LYFLEPVLTLAGVVILALIIQFNLEGGWQDTFGAIALIAILVTAVWTGVRYLKWTTTSFVLTDDRVIYRRGVFAKSGVQIPLERINNVNFRQGFFERLAGAGDLLIESGGESGQSRFTDVRHPDQVQKLIHAQIDLAGPDGLARYHQSVQEAQSAQMPPPPPPAQVVDVPGQLERLEGLLQRGSITRAEYEQQKAKILNS
jgi:membrane protein YdbS with pleckstrin-like domain